MDEEQQQHQEELHRGIVDAIVRLSDPYLGEERHMLVVNGFNGSPVDRYSLDHLVTFLDNGDAHDVQITELYLDGFELSNPSDGGLNVLRTFFSRNDTTLTKVTLCECNFGTAEDASQLLAAFETNRTVTGLAIQYAHNLEEAALGHSLASLMQNMPQLQQLDCEGSSLSVQGVRALQPALQANRTVTELHLCGCGLGDEGLRLLADSLAGNTIMKVLNISSNQITSNGLDDITRLLESTRIKTYSLPLNIALFGDEALDVASIRRFTRVLSRHEFVKELNISFCDLGDDGLHLITDGLVGNTIMEVLEICQNNITPNGLANITRILESTQLKTIHLWGNWRVFQDKEATKHFVTTLQHTMSTIQELPCIGWWNFPLFGITVTEMYYAAINIILARNRQLNHVNLLLTSPPASHQQLLPPRHHHCSGSGGGSTTNTSLLLIKTWHKAIARFAMVPNDAGASAIFKLFTTRPQLFEKRLQRPASAGAGTNNGNSNNHESAAGAVTTSTLSRQQKRQRL